MPDVSCVSDREGIYLLQNEPLVLHAEDVTYWPNSRVFKPLNFKKSPVVCDQGITTAEANQQQLSTTMWACLVLGVLGSAAANNVFPIPEPYRWDETFTVESPQMDAEHRGLFNAILRIE